MTAPEDASAARAVGIMLPVDWFIIRLSDAQERTERVSAYVARQFRGVPANPALQGAMRSGLQSMADSLANAGGELMAFSTMMADNLPVHMTLTVKRTRTPNGMRDVVTSMKDLPGIVAAEGATGSVIRRVSIDQGKGATDALQPFAGSGIPMLKVEYWLEPPDGKGIYHAIFTSAHVEQQDAFVELFDVLISSVDVV